MGASLGEANIEKFIELTRCSGIVLAVSRKPIHCDKNFKGGGRSMPQVIAFINMKGGVGKTTLAVNVAHGLASVHKQRVLIVDADPQFNATQYLLDDEVYLAHINDVKKGTIREIFMPRRSGPVDTVAGTSKQTNKSRMSLKVCSCNIFDGGPGRGKLDLIPSTLNLMDIETSKRGTENKLNAYLKEKASGYDYVLIDCPPTISIFTQAAILASDMYLVPIKPDPLSVIGLPLLERWLEEYTDDAGKEITTAGLVFTLVRGPLPNRMKEVMEELADKRHDDVFESHLSQAAAVAQSVEAHQPVFQFKPHSKSAHQILNITKELLERTLPGD
jgi:chromosome partitioning protein